MPTIKPREDGVNGCVYFFRVQGTNDVKIGGCSINSPRTRFCQIQAIMPYKIELIGWIRTKNFLRVVEWLNSQQSRPLLNGWCIKDFCDLVNIFCHFSGYKEDHIAEMITNKETISIDVLSEIDEKYDKKDGGFNTALLSEFLSARLYNVCLSRESGTDVSYARLFKEYKAYVGGEIGSASEFKSALAALGYLGSYNGMGVVVEKIGGNND